MVTEDVFLILFKLFQVRLVIVMSSATCERCFSSKRRINNWLRKIMAQAKLIVLTIINIERDLSTKINNENLK